ncbi:MAG: response regulator transcription factor [Clostridia bacterium]|nr:response regulator transcription factor [Clostridia bacterium]
MPKILVVDDEAGIRTLIKKYATFEGHEILEADNGMEAIEMCRNDEFDMVIMDVMMPELDGFSAVREIKKISDVPVIMLSARTEEYDKIHGFEIGVDDYVEKPFSPKELMLRINAVLRRYAAQPKAATGDSAHEVLTFGKLKIDFTGRYVYINDEKVELTPKEYDLLFYMVRNRNIALTRTMILDNVWGYDFYGDERTLDTHIKLLRKSLGECSSYLVTLRGVGYRFEA